MKVNLVQPEVQLLQRVGNAGKFIGEQGAQIAFFAADQNSYFVGVDHGTDFHIAERRGVQPDPHLGLSSSVDHLRHLYGAAAGIDGKLSRRRYIRRCGWRAGGTAAIRFMCGPGRCGRLAGRSRCRSLNRRLQRWIRDGHRRRLRRRCQRTSRLYRHRG